jgi:hypothetical protein
VSVTRFKHREEGEIVPQGDSVTGTEHAVYYRVRVKNIIVLVKVYKDASMKVSAEEALDDGSFLAMSWEEFNDRN